MFNLNDEIKKGEYLFPNTIEEIDQFSGKEFENFLFYFFKAAGYKVRKTNDSSDKGIDILVTFDDESKTPKTLGIQAKRWSQNVNSQEIRNMLDGKDEYNCDFIWLVTTSGVTQDANTTALNNNISIKDRDYMAYLIKQLHEMPNIKFKPITKIADSGANQDLTALLPKERDLYDKLRELRKIIANEEKTQIWMVFSNQTILDIIKQSPKKVQDLTNIRGFGNKKLDKYGERIIALFS